MPFKNVNNFKIKRSYENLVERVFMKNVLKHNAEFSSLDKPVLPENNRK